ncbi:helix-turn-helix domain-containing protein [Rhodococcus sp. 3Y1]
MESDEDVSERSGVALGTLYRYFPTKQQLLAAAMTAWSGLESVRRPESCGQTVARTTRTSGFWHFIAAR